MLTISRTTTSRAGLAVALAAALAVPAVESFGRGWPGWTKPPSWRSMRVDPGPGPVAEARASLGDLAGIVPPGSVVAYLVRLPAPRFAEEDRAVQRYFAAGHFLAPAVVRLVHLPDCLARGPGPCGISRASFVLVREDVDAPVASLLARAGFLPRWQGPGGLLLARSAP
jgi:hypothetical protein